MDTTYAPPPSLEGFLLSESFVSLVTGPVGSGKSSASMVKIAYHAQRMRPGKDGIRRSRAVIVRNTREMLRDSTLPTFTTWFPDGDAGAYLKTDFKFYLEFGDVSCEVLFRGLDDSNDVRRLLSLEVSFGVMDEFREIHPDIFNALQGRVGRYPAKKDGGCVTDDGSPNSHIWGASNAPDADTFWSEYLDNPPSVASVFMQPSALSPEADWTENLLDGYYENIAEGKTQDWVDVYIHNLFGRSLSGQPVFRCFDKELHVAKEPLKPNVASQHPLLVGFDCTGLNPACAIGQLGFGGRLSIFDTLYSADMGPLRFVKEMLKPLLVNKFAGIPVVLIIDPAGMNRESDERSVRDMLVSERFVVKPARTNNISPRISVVEQFMTRLVDGKPAFVIDPGCTDLITALRSKYRFKVNTKGEKDDKPDKNHPHSDLCFVAGTQVLTPTGYRAIETLRLWDAVCVPDGVDYITAVGSSQAPELMCVELSDGTSLTCTPDHPFILSNTCVLRADALSYADMLTAKEHGAWANGQWRTRASGRLLVRAGSVVGSLKLRLGAWLKEKANTVARGVTDWVVGLPTGLSTTACGSLALERTHITGINGAMEPPVRYTDIHGSSIMAQCQRGTTCITSTEIQPTMTLVTLSACRVESIAEHTWQRGGLGVNSGSPTKLGPQRLSGIDQRPGENGIGGTRRSRLQRLLTSVRSAGKSMFGFAESTKGITAPLRVIRSSFVGSGRVYNITTRRSHVYYAGSALVHNCDALQYLCLHADGGAMFGRTVDTGGEIEVEKVSALGWT